MARLYSEELYVAHNIESDDFTVPAGQVWVIRSIAVFAAGPVAGGTAQLVDGTYDSTFWWSAIEPTTAGAYVLSNDVRFVRPEGRATGIIINAGLGEGGDITISGYALTLP